jgi:hypothetical protein
VSPLITHFTYKAFVSEKSRRREYLFSFFYKGVMYRGVYHYNGAIDWHEKPEDEDVSTLTSRVHELMLFHEFDD